MKRVLALLLILCLSCVGGQASPEVQQYKAVLHPQIRMKGIFADPFDRWAKEFGDMLSPVVEQASWPEGESISVDIVASGTSAIRFELVRDGELIALRCSLMGEGQVLLTGADALGALYLMDNARWALEPDTEWPNADCTLHVQAGELSYLLREVGDVFDRWAANAPPDQRESAGAVALSVFSLSDILSGQPEATPVLSVYVHYEAPGEIPAGVDKKARAAPESLLGSMLSEAPMKIARTIASEWEKSAAVQKQADDVQ